MDIKRYHFIDELRGIGIIYVVFYHIIYNLTYIFPSGITFIEEPWMYVLRDVMVGMLIFISGVSGVFSKNNFKRGLKTLVFALIITGITFLMGEDYLITFGILHFFGVCMLLYSMIAKYLYKIPSILGGASFSLLFFIFKMNSEIYYLETGVHFFPYFALGIDYHGFISSDYYPLIPWIFIFLAGSFFGKFLISKKENKGLYKENSKLLSIIGQNTMIIYLLHQPIVYGVMYMVYRM